MITLVSFMRPVNIKSVGVEDWSLKRDGKDISVADKGNHLLFTCTIAGKTKRSVKVPLTNIASVTSDEDIPAEEPAPKKAKADKEDP